MSVELYPHVEDLNERLSALEDPDLAARILSANPQLFPSAAAQEEISVFAAAWKRAGALALALAATLAIVAAPLPLARDRAPVALPAPARHVAAPQRHAAAVVRPRPAPVHKAAAATVVVPVQAPAVVPVHHAAVMPRPFVAHHIAAAAAPATSSRASLAPAAAAAVAAPAQVPLGHDPNAVVVSNANAPAQDAPQVSYTKGNPPGASGSQPTQWGPPAVVDSCTPQGGRIGSILQAVGR